MFWVEFPQFLFLGKPPYVRYLCRSLVLPCRAVEFCPVFAVPEGNDFGSVSGLPTIQELSLGEPNLEVEQILFLEFLRPVHDQGQIRRILL